jgi:hypothetical protein
LSRSDVQLVAVDDFERDVTAPDVHLDHRSDA